MVECSVNLKKVSFNLFHKLFMEVPLSREVMMDYDYCTIGSVIFEMTDISLIKGYLDVMKIALDIANKDPARQKDLIHFLGTSNILLTIESCELECDNDIKQQISGFIEALTSLSVD